MSLVSIALQDEQVDQVTGLVRSIIDIEGLGKNGRAITFTKRAILYRLLLLPLFVRVSLSGRTGCIPTVFQHFIQKRFNSINN